MTCVDCGAAAEMYMDRCRTCYRERRVLEKAAKWADANKMAAVVSGFCASHRSVRRVRGTNVCESCHANARCRNRGRARANAAGYLLQVKKEALRAYGGACGCCGEDRLELLTLDHIDGRGAEHRRRTGRGGHIYRWLRSRGFPAGFRVLCFNCNCSIGTQGYCPHARERAMVEGDAYALAQLRGEAA